jgi:transcriptional regulator of arginine metabolism
VPVLVLRLCGYSLAYDIDNNHFHEIIGTIAGDDTIMLIVREGCTRTSVKQALAHVIPNINLIK